MDAGCWCWLKPIPYPRIVLTSRWVSAAHRDRIDGVHMKGEPKVIEFLNGRCGTNSPPSTSTGCTIACSTTGAYKTLAKQWRKESIEEMEHADKLVDRIIFLDGFPNMQVLDPLHIGQNVKEVLDCDLKAEISARALYEEAATHCHGVQRLRHARPVREADEGRGGPHRLPREADRSRQANSASSSTRSTTSARSATRRISGADAPLQRSTDSYRKLRRRIPPCCGRRPAGSFDS